MSEITFEDGKMYSWIDLKNNQDETFKYRIGADDEEHLKILKFSFNDLDLGILNKTSAKYENALIFSKYGIFFSFYFKDEVMYKNTLNTKNHNEDKEEKLSNTKNEKIFKLHIEDPNNPHKMSLNKSSKFPVTPSVLFETARPDPDTAARPQVSEGEVDTLVDENYTQTDKTETSPTLLTTTAAEGENSTQTYKIETPAVEGGKRFLKKRKSSRKQKSRRKNNKKRKTLKLKRAKRRRSSRKFI